MEGKKPYLAVILIQSIYAGMFLLSKAAFNGGMNNFVFVFYRQAAATVFLVPLAIFFERKTAPPLSFVTFCKIFMLSLCGITFSLNMYGVALVYTSATLAAATSNTLPVITFFFAVLLRMEIVKLRTLSGIAKIVGIIVCMAGAATLAFYKGPQLKPLIHHHPFGHHNSVENHVLAHSSQRWVKGCFLMLTSNTLWGLWLVMQARVLACYPSKLLSTTLQCFLSTIQSFTVAVAFERNPYQWKLSWDVGLLAVAYCVTKQETLLNVLGGILLVGGLYSVLWGKSKEQMMDTGRSDIEDGKQCLELKETVPSTTTRSPLVFV
ncbi:hypothetical protein HHK36_007959 [Tetracentron sinense]|uniref:WAT1-related protein n=1 Tax=Tetracentron sinense TaxID=13715 RepID=A0A834ZFJ5_TETSI|nr:hypothetical protein HHK36_007959 [Tetracentron sinense]